MVKKTFSCRANAGNLEQASSAPQGESIRTWDSLSLAYVWNQPYNKKAYE